MLEERSKIKEENDGVDLALSHPRMDGRGSRDLVAD